MIDADRMKVGRRRVLLWDCHFDRVQVEELAVQGIDVVLTVFGGAHGEGLDGIPHVPLHVLLDGTPGFEALAPRADIRLTADEFRRLARGASRLARVPFTHAVFHEFGGMFALDEIEPLARVYVSRCLQLLETHRVEEVWFTIVPHYGLDDAMAVAARLARIPVLVTRQLPFPAKFVWEWWWDGAVHHVAPNADFARWERGAAPLDLFYMMPRQWDPPAVAWRRRFRDGISALASGDWRVLLARAWRGAVDRRQWRWAIWLETLDPALRAQAARHRQALREAKRARAQRRLLRISGSETPFVYFPLHYEPEANADVYGGEFAFQPDALAALSAALPKGWSILIKENPAQGFVRRGEAFHRLIEALPNVFWAPDDTPSALLVERAALVASLCGTVGYEALLAGKPCLYFGDPWYAGLPGAVRFEPSLDLAALARSRVDKAELDAAVNALLSAAADGIVVRRFTALVPDGGESEAMARLTARSLARISQAARDRFRCV